MDGQIECGFFSGAERGRTADLLNAIQVLSQLSYSPTGRKALAHIPGDFSANPNQSPESIQAAVAATNRHHDARVSNSLAARRNLSETSAPPSIRAISSVRSV